MRCHVRSHPLVPALLVSIEILISTRVLLVTFIGPDVVTSAMVLVSPVVQLRDDERREESERGWARC